MIDLDGDLVIDGKNNGNYPPNGVTGIFAATRSSGRGGNVHVVADNITIRNNGEINSATTPATFRTFANGPAATSLSGRGAGC
jgi:hypothetical protein